MIPVLNTCHTDCLVHMPSSLAFSQMSTELQTGNYISQNTFSCVVLAT